MRASFDFNTVVHGSFDEVYGSFDRIVGSMALWMAYTTSVTGCGPHLISTQHSLRVTSTGGGRSFGHLLMVYLLMGDLAS